MPSLNVSPAAAAGLKKELKALRKQSASQNDELIALRKDRASVTISMEAAEQQLQSKAEELKQHLELVAQQDSDLVQLRQEHAQSVAACNQLHADAVVAAEREAALQAQAGRQQDQLAGEMFVFITPCIYLALC